MVVSGINIKSMIGVLFAFILIGCRSSLQNKLANIIDRDCGIQTNLGCKIKLKDETDFKWDKMYIFESWTTSDSIASKIGFNYNGDDIYDNVQRILFTYGNKIAYEEDIDYLDGANILFDNLHDTVFLSKYYYSPSEAIFKLDHHKTDGASEFYLTRITLNNNTGQF